MKSEKEGCPVRARFAACRAGLCDGLIERDAEVDLVLTAVLCREHALLVSPPGCAKSLLLDGVMSWVGGRTFSALLTRFTQPEELFGPLSLAALREGRYVRVTAGRLPEADGAFLDEVWKASSAVLNTLLRILNERVFDPGDGVPVRVPLRVCVAASNEWPDPHEGGKELAAAFDRFLLRKEVKPIRSRAGRERLLWGEGLGPAVKAAISPDELDAASEEAAALPWGEDAKGALGEVLRELMKEGVVPGDRRQRKAVGAARAYAWLNGADEVAPEHLEVLQHVLWDDPREQPDVCAKVIGRVANPPGMRVSGLLLECEQVLASTDVKVLAQAATAAAKLTEVERQLAALGADPRAERARLYVKDQVRGLKLASLEAV